MASVKSTQNEPKFDKISNFGFRRLSKSSAINPPISYPKMRSSSTDKQKQKKKFEKTHIFQRRSQNVSISNPIKFSLKNMIHNYQQIVQTSKFNILNNYKPQVHKRALSLTKASRNHFRSVGSSKNRRAAKICLQSMGGPSVDQRQAFSLTAGNMLSPDQIT